MRTFFFIWLTITLSLVTRQVHAQFSAEEQGLIDSLNLLIKNTSSDDTTVSEAYIELSNIHYAVNLDTLIPLCSIAESIIEKALLSKPSTSVTRKLKINLAAAYSNIGYVHDIKGNIPLAIDYYSKALKIQEEYNYQEGMATSYNNIGSIHENQGNLESALEYYLKSLEIGRAIGDKEEIAVACHNIGLLYYALKDTDLALKSLLESLSIHKEFNDLQGVSYSYTALGYVYQMEGQSIEALKYYDKSLRIQKELQDLRGVVYSYHNMARINLTNNDLEEASLLGVKGYEVAKRIGFPSEVMYSTQLLSEIYEEKGDGIKALGMHKLYIQMRDSINNTETQKAAIKQATKYEYEKKKAIDDKENEKKIAVEKEAQKRQFIVLVIVIIASALVLILLLIIYRRLRITRKQKLVIEEQKEEVETQRDQIEGQKDEIEQKHGEIQESIAYAKRIQNAILPPESFMNQHLPNNFVYYQPKDVVAGDFYWMEVHNDIVFFAAADCTGHGVPGAMVSVVCHNALNRAVREFGLRDTGKILDKVRELVLSTFEKSEEQMKDGMDICLCALNKKSNSLQFSGANNPLYLIKDRELETIKGTKQPIGHVQDPKPFESHNIDLKNIDSFYLTTDGYADQFGGPKNKKFTHKQLRELLVENHSKPMNEQHDILKSELNSWIEQGRDEQIDDVCIIGISI